MLAGEVVAVEVNEARARELEEAVGRWARRTSGSSSPTAARCPHELTGFDRALVDAPCSGLGVLNRRPGSALARRAAPGAAARAPAGGRRARSCRRDDRLLGLHDQRRRVGGRRRCLRARGRSDARGGVAAVPASAAPGVPADAAARPRHGRVLRRTPQRALRISPRLLDVLVEPAAPLVPRPGEVVRDAPAAGALAVEAEIGEGVEPAGHRRRAFRRSPSPRARARPPAASGRSRATARAPRGARSRRGGPGSRGSAPSGRPCDRRRARRRAARRSNGSPAARVPARNISAQRSASSASEHEGMRLADGELEAREELGDDGDVVDSAVPELRSRNAALDEESAARAIVGRAASRQLLVRPSARGRRPRCRLRCATARSA